MSNSIDLDRYFARIAYEGLARPDLETLRALQLAHVTSIPYENIDARIGRPISLDMPDIEEKLVVRRRGGWCYEQTALYQAALTAIGFETRAVHGVVRYRFSPIIDPHMLLIATIGGVEYLTEVGFGGLAPLLPVRFDAEAEEQFGLRYRVSPGKRDYLLQCWWEGDFRTVYAFTLDDYAPEDRERDNAEGCQLGPSRSLKVHLLGRESRCSIDNGLYREWNDQGLASQRPIKPDELIELLSSRFGIELTAEDASRLVEAETAMAASVAAPRVS